MFAGVAESYMTASAKKGLSSTGGTELVWCVDGKISAILDDYENLARQAFQTVAEAPTEITKPVSI